MYTCSPLARHWFARRGTRLLSPQCSSKGLSRTQFLMLACKSAREQLSSCISAGGCNGPMLPSLIMLMVHAQPHQGCTQPPLLSCTAQPLELCQYLGICISDVDAAGSHFHYVLLSYSLRQSRLSGQPLAEAVRAGPGLLIPSAQEQLPGAAAASCCCQAQPAGCSSQGSSSWSSASHQGASSMVQRGV